MKESQKQHAAGSDTLPMSRNHGPRGTELQYYFPTPRKAVETCIPSISILFDQMRSQHNAKINLTKRVLKTEIRHSK